MNGNEQPMIEQIKKAPVVRLPSSIPDQKERLKNLRKVYVEDPETIRQLKRELNPSKDFWTERPLGRTLTGRNKAGRTIRRIGGVAGAIGASLLGIDVGILGDIVGGADQAVEINQTLQQVEQILLIVAGIIGMIFGGADYAEIRGDRMDDREVFEGVESSVRKLTRKLKGE